MVVVVVYFAGFHERLDRIGLAGGVTAQFTAGAQALVRLDVRACRYFLQVERDGFVALDAFESQGTGWFRHGGKIRVKQGF